MAYPDPLPTSGQLSIMDIYYWMQDAGEWPPDSPEFQYTKSLENAVLYSHLTDKSTPYAISDFYGYAVLPTYAEHSISDSSFLGSSGACAFSSGYRTVYTDPQFTVLSTMVQVFTDSSLTATLEGGYYQYNSTTWLEVDSSGIIQSMGSC